MQNILVRKARIKQWYIGHYDTACPVKMWSSYNSFEGSGYYTGPIDGEFGPGQGFLNSVKAFQQAEGLAADGVIGPATRAESSIFC